ncbi:unnamed protein product, partial [Meganyctiphanes norvegica]
MAFPINVVARGRGGAETAPSRPNTYLGKVKKNQNISLKRNMYNNALKKVGADSAPPPPLYVPLAGTSSLAPDIVLIAGGRTFAGGSALHLKIPVGPMTTKDGMLLFVRASGHNTIKCAKIGLNFQEIGEAHATIKYGWPTAAKRSLAGPTDQPESRKADYTKALEVYHASPAYQQYLVAKAKGATAAAEDKEVAPSAVAVGTKLDRRIDIQPAEDEEDYDDGLTVKHVAHSRYVRNHRLINDIFSDTMVPDVRSVVTSQRLTVLRRQVQSLTMHQKKLETELQQIEEKFEAKKRKFVEAGDSFQLELKKVKATAPKLDVGSFETLVERQREILRREAEDRQRAAQGLPPLSQDKENHEAPAGPQPQNTATLVDATPSPIPPQQDNDASAEDEMKTGGELP